MSGAQRTVSYGYDNLYRLTQETVVGAAVAGTIDYTYDAVGNRLTRNSSLGNILTSKAGSDLRKMLRVNILQQLRVDIAA